MVRIPEKCAHTQKVILEVIIEDTDITDEIFKIFLVNLNKELR